MKTAKSFIAARKSREIPENLAPFWEAQTTYERSSSRADSGAQPCPGANARSNSLSCPRTGSRSGPGTLAGSRASARSNSCSRAFPCADAGAGSSTDARANARAR